MWPKLLQPVHLTPRKEARMPTVAATPARKRAAVAELMCLARPGPQWRYSGTCGILLTAQQGNPCTVQWDPCRPRAGSVPECTIPGSPPAEVKVGLRPERETAV